MVKEAVQYLIVGNGVAGTTAAEQVRKHDDQGDITIITDEPLPFYYRIRLNDYIAGDIGEQELIARKPEWYVDRRIRLLTGSTITAADPDKRFVRTQSGDKFHYDRLLLATGSHSFVPLIKGAEKRGVFTLRNVADARGIIAFCGSAKKAVLVGGGLLGLETGNALRKLGREVTVVEFFPRLLPRQIDARGAEILQKNLEGMGFSFVLGATTREFVGNESVRSVALEDGRQMPADMVIISAGVRPNLDLAARLGLACQKGVVVDAQLRTSRPEVFAAGDVAEYQGILYGIWPAAQQQGLVAGANMAGADLAYAGTTMATRLKVAGIDLASAGEIDAGDSFDSRRSEKDGRYRKIVVHEDRVIGCILLGDSNDYAKLTRAIAEQTRISDLPAGLL